MIRQFHFPRAALFLGAGLGIVPLTALGQTAAPTSAVSVPAVSTPANPDSGPLFSVPDTVVLPNMCDANYDTPAPDSPYRLSPPAFVPRGVAQLGELALPPDTAIQTLEDVHPWLQSVATLYPDRVTLRVIGWSSQGRPVIALEVRPPSSSSGPSRRIVVQCRQHGDEPEATASGTRFLYEWLTSTNPAQAKVSSSTTLLFVAVANPDGAAKCQRRSGADIDMNRDWGIFRSPEVRALAGAFTAWKPQLVVDVHQWDPAPHMPPPMAEGSGGELAERTAWAMAAADGERGLPLAARYHWGLDTLCHRYFGQRLHIPAILLESRHMPTIPGYRAVAIATTVTALWSAAGNVSGA